MARMVSIEFFRKFRRWVVIFLLGFGVVAGIAAYLVFAGVIEVRDCLLFPSFFLLLMGLIEAFVLLIVIAGLSDAREGDFYPVFMIWVMVISSFVFSIAPGLAGLVLILI